MIIKYNLNTSEPNYPIQAKGYYYTIFLVLIFSAFSEILLSQDIEYVTAKVKSGDGITNLLMRYGLDANSYNIDFIKENNSSKITSRNGLMVGEYYLLPIRIYKYNSKSIRTTLDISDYEFAKSIQNYNLKMHRKGLKSGDYRKDLILWLPLSMSSDSKKTSNQTKELKNLTSQVTEPLFGDNYKIVKIINHTLKDCIFYIVSGHGGVDPGAVGYKDGIELHEDEYAYDVSLRLARRLIEYGADVYVIVQDPNDGIRDDKYLKNSYDEFHIGNEAIPLQQNERLTRRTAIINELYNKNLSRGKNQYCIETHVDSRYTGKNVDIFFYYKDGNTDGKTMAENLMKTIKQKYEKAQPGRGYEGSVSSRGLYMLRNVKPTSVFIEIGNIQNPRDQIRIIEPNNRQAIANWLTDGIIYTISGKK
ncbi:MAG: N-acetylmuramoyl-L-alanine amidase [Candidatus Kapabacteria bacterium]|nr:N-acetylmuramoyl-L-alanine amidase [Ignavibacteriota bacterium]MCW5885714.1 N-acetylmuramoyl-L-alanine amidase [Candidatus Kapabacteria bacterium]